MATTNTCKKCGCEDNFMPSPAPCPTPTGCPTPQPCSEVFDAQCVVYTGADIECGNDTVVTSNTNVAEALNNIVDKICSSIHIPELQIFSTGKQLFVSLLPTLNSTEFLNHNPKIFLFNKRNAKTKKIGEDINGPIYGYYHTGWRHTSHLNGINYPNSKFYGGSTMCPTHSEFPLTITGPYQRQLLSDFNLEEFYIYQDPTIPAPIDGTTILWSDRDSVIPRGRTSKRSNNRSAYFRFAIGIENPDPNSEFPILFGPMTASIQCKLVRYIDEQLDESFVTYAINIEPTNIKRNIPNVL